MTINVKKEIIDEFDQAISEYKDEKRFIHTKYLADFIRENPAKFPVLSQVQKRTALETRLTGCFRARKEFRRYRMGNRIGNGAIWERIGDRAGELYIQSDKASPDD
jgi:hypothetical protein